MKITDNGDGTYTHIFEPADLRAFVDARLQAAVDEKIAEWEAEDEQRILYGTGDPDKMPKGVIYVNTKRHKE